MTWASRHAMHGLCAMALMVQVAFWSQMREVHPDVTIVPSVPGKQAVHALALGDEQAYFRVLALYLQNSGDYFGHFTALKNYDFNKLYHWFTLLDTLDTRSDMIPSIASYYYSQTQHVPDVRYVVDYLYEHATHNIERKWWWLLQSIYLAMHKLKDNDLALKVALPLVDTRVPIFAQQMAAVVREQRGEMEDALTIMETIAQNADKISDRDLRYMTYFVDERLKALDRQKKSQARAMMEELKKKKEPESPAPVTEPKKE